MLTCRTARRWLRCRSRSRCLCRRYLRAGLDPSLITTDDRPKWLIDSGQIRSSASSFIFVFLFLFFFCSPRAMSPLPASLPQSASQSPLNGNALTRYNNKCLPSLDIQCAISRRTVQTTLRLTRSEQTNSKTPYKNTKSYLLRTEKHITKKVLKLFFYCDKTKSTK